MYQPNAHIEGRVEVMHELIRRHPLGLIVTMNADGLNGNHIPLEIDPEPAPYGTLRGHVARANSLWRETEGAVMPMVVFQGPSRYVTPSWYPSKQATGKVVPTYNYMVVHAYGRLRAIDDPAWLRSFLDRLTARHEQHRPMPWKIDDAPADYLEAMLKAIVGIEIRIERLIGKWKISQNRMQQDHAGVIAGLESVDADDAREMLEAMRPPGA